jgi:hypothetical protein
MRCKLQMVIETENGEAVHEIAHIERGDMAIETVGLSLAEAKSLLGGVQRTLVEQQIAEQFRHGLNCPDCGKALLSKGSHVIVFRTLFGNLELKSPRLLRCDCQPGGTLSFSPLAEMLAERTAPERVYLETKWASQMSFEMTAKLLADVLPLDRQVNGAGIRHHLHQVAQRAEAELGEERSSFIDGGYVRQWDDKKKHFELIVGKSMPEKTPTNASASFRPTTKNPSAACSSY